MNEIVSVPRLDPIHSNMLEDVQVTVQEIVEHKDFERGFHVIRSLLTYVKAVDDSVGIVLNGMSSVWNPEEQDGETFENAIRRTTGLQPVTVQRHLKVQKALPIIPEDYREQIQDKGFKTKIQIANIVAGGYEVDDEDWRDLAESPDEKETGRIVRRIKGVEPRSNWLSISIDGNGVLRVHTVRGVEEVGRLYTHSEDADVQKAISRLIGCTGVQPASEY